MIEEKVRKIFFQLCGEEIIDNAITLQNDLALDSIQMVTLLVEIEDTFNIELDETDMNPFDLTTVQNVVDLVEKYCGGDKDG